MFFIFPSHTSLLSLIRSLANSPIASVPPWPTHVPQHPEKKPPIPFETGGPPSQRPNFLYPSNGARLKSTVAVPFATTVTCFSKASISSCQPMMVWLPTGTFGSE
jgi:hypothetical protein